MNEYFFFTEFMSRLQARFHKVFTLDKIFSDASLFRHASVKIEGGLYYDTRIRTGDLCPAYLILRHDTLQGNRLI